MNDIRVPSPRHVGQILTLPIFDEDIVLNRQQVTPDAMATFRTVTFRAVEFRQGRYRKWLKWQRV